MLVVDPVRYVKLKASGKLPSLNGVALAIIRLLQRDDYKIDDLVRLVQSDPAIAGALLKFSNAASYGHSRPIISLSKAITTLGTLRVRVLVLALSVLNDHRKGQCPHFDYGHYWSHSLATAISAQALASHAKIIPEENFTAGLLCRVGELALASIFPERYGEIISSPSTNLHHRLTLEREAFDTDHRELAATLLLEWGLPEILATAIFHSEAPDEAAFQEGSRIQGLTQSLQIALAMADICIAEDTARWTMLPNLFSKAARLGISTDELSSMADDIIAGWHEWGEILNIQTSQINSFAELLPVSNGKEQVSSHAACQWPNNKTALLVCVLPPETAEISRYLQLNGYTLKFASNSRDGLEMALGQHQELIMIEMSSPEIDGLSFCQSLRSNSHGKSSYIILIFDHEDAGLLRKALDMGADDILVKPISESTLLTKLHGAFKIIHLQKELIKERTGLMNFAGEWAGFNRRMTHIAMTDPLTQLANRRYGLDFLVTEWAFSRSNNLPLACLMIDIDHFKKVNDTYGHQVGDAVLVKLANFLLSGARSGDLVFRYGGEEFCIICPAANLETAGSVAERIRQNVASSPFQIDMMIIAVTVSIGVAIMGPTHANEDGLIRDADAALFRAKEAGRNRVEL